MNVLIEHGGFANRGFANNTKLDDNILFHCQLKGREQDIKIIIYLQGLNRSHQHKEYRYQPKSTFGFNPTGAGGFQTEMVQYTVRYIFDYKMELEEISAEARHFYSEFEYESSVIDTILDPKSNKLFNKQYLSPQSIQITHFIDDARSYHQQLNFQYQKLFQKLSQYKLMQNLVNFVIKINVKQIYFTDYLLKIIGHLSQIKSIRKHQQKSQNSVCSNCQQSMAQQSILKQKDKLNLCPFQDPYQMYNIEKHLYGEKAALKKQSEMIMKSLDEYENKYEFEGTCMAKQEYHRLLNELGTDISFSTVTIQKSVTHFENLMQQIVNGQAHFGVNSDQIEQFEKIIDKKLMQKNTKIILALFYKRLSALRRYKRVDCQVQVCLKQNQVIKELQKKKKQQRAQIRQLQQERAKNAIQFEKRLKQLEKTIEDITESHQAVIKVHQKEQEIVVLENNQLKALINILKEQLNQETQKFVKLNAELIGYRNRKSRKKSALGQNRISKELKVRQKKSSIFSKRSSSISKRDKQLQFISKEAAKGYQSTNLSPESKKRKTIDSISRKQSIIPGNSQLHYSSKQISKKGSFNQSNSGQQTQGQTNTQQLRKQKVNKKTSRFRALASFIQSIGPIEVKEQDKSEAQSSNSIEENKKRDILMNLHRLMVSQDNRFHLNPQQFMNYFDTFIDKIRRNRPILEEDQTDEYQQQFQTNPSSKHKNKQNFNHYNKAEPQMQNETKTKKTFKLGTIQRHKQFYLRKNRNLDTEYHPSNKSLNNEAHDISRANTVNEFTQNAQSPLTRSSKRLNTLHQLKDRPQREANLQSLSHSVAKNQLFQTQEILSLFLSQENIVKYCTNHNFSQTKVLSTEQNRIMMKSMTLLAQLRFKSLQYYNQFKTVLFYPDIMIDLEIQKDRLNSEIKWSLKESLKQIIGLHRKCKKNDQKDVCEHLVKLLSKIQSVSTIASEMADNNNSEILVSKYNHKK